MATRILIGDVRAKLAELADESVHCVVTSVPYYGLRAYLPDGHPDKRFEMGGEPTLAEYLVDMVGVFREVKRVMRRDATCWLNIGDSYARDMAKGQHKPGDSGKQDYIITEGGGKAAGGMKFRMKPGEKHFGVHMGHCNQGDYEGVCCYGEDERCPALPEAPGGGLKPKDLMMVPARLALALQDDGWWIRKDIIWAKPNPMPESCTDRPTSSHEHIFLLTKSERYFFDAEAVRETAEFGPSIARDGAKHGPFASKELGEKGGFRGGSRASSKIKIPGGWDRGAGGHGTIHRDGRTSAEYQEAEVRAGRNIRDVWIMASAPFPEAHFATFPPELPERCINAGTSEHGCCPSCGAPWRRVVGAAEPTGGRGAGNGFKRPERLTHADANGARGDETPWVPKSRSTTGWEKACACEVLPPVPAVVLDPFAGACTTLMVADQLGRDAVGIELSEAYAAMGQRRIAASRGELRIEGEGLFAAVPLPGPVPLPLFAQTAD